MLSMEEVDANSNRRSPGSPLRLLACSGSLDGGGSERQLWQLVSRLDRKRFAPEVFLLHKRGPYLEQLPADVPVWPERPAWSANSTSWFPSRFIPGSISSAQSRQLRELVRSRGIDVVYDRTYHMSLLTGWALPASQPRVSVIVSPPSRDLPTSERRFVFLKRRLLARAYRTATVTICVSSEVADDAARFYGLPRERLTVLHNPIDVDTVRKLAESKVAEAQVSLLDTGPKPRLNIALVGRFTVEKGHRFALELLKAWQDQQIPNRVPLHLHFIGDGPLRCEIEELIKAWSLAGYVHLHGYQTNPYPFMAACDCVLVPSRYEGFPNVALEAMALGVPLMMTEYGDTARAIAGQSERAVLIPLDNVAQALQCLADRVANSAAWQARAAVAQAWIEREHAIGPWLDKMMSLLEHASRERRNS